MSATQHAWRSAAIARAVGWAEAGAAAEIRRPGGPRRLRPALAALRRSPLMHVAQFLLLMSALVWLVLQGSGAMGYNWQWSRVPQYLYKIDDDGALIWGPLVLGLMQTVKISAYSLLLAVSIGLATALMRMSASVAGRWAARGYLELIRNTPLLVQLNLFYFIVAPIFDVGRFWTGVLCLAVFEGAYASEIFRAGILAVPKGQWEASASLGLSRIYTYRFVVLPQAIRTMLPPLAGVGISLIKDSAIVSVIALSELTTAGRDAISESFMSFEIWFTVAAIYLVLTASLSVFVSYLEHRFRART